MTDRSIDTFDSQGARYDEAFRVFLANTDQKVRAREWLQTTVGNLPSRKLLVDVGAGNGILTAWLGENFERTIALEPNLTLLDELKRVCPRAESLAKPLWDLDLEPSADFVICSHVLYYIEDELWPAALEKMASWLSPTGMVAVALQNPNSDGMKMVNHFTGRKFDLRGAVEKVGRNSDFTTRFELVRSHVTAPDLETAFQVGTFVLNVTPNPKPPTESAIKNYFQTNLEDGNGGYRFSVDQDFLVIERRS